ncbi:transcriptional regulator [Edwardsiella tarda]|uniref:transcriptional regulator n=1 Tax=Edwardsiella tarda TaxID=636 RepID=UPI00351C57EC
MASDDRVVIKCKDPRICRFYADYLNNKYPNEFPQYEPNNAENCLRNINDFLKEKYPPDCDFLQFNFRSQLKKEINDLEIASGIAILPENTFLWLKNDEHATFFTWARIYTENGNYTTFHDESKIEVRKRRANVSDKLNTYKALGLIDNPSSHNERFKMIISYFDGCHALNHKGKKIEHMDSMKQIWLKNYNKPRNFKWLDPNDDEMCRWFWARIKEKQMETPGGVTPVTLFFTPSSTKEHYLASLAAFDLWQTQQDTMELFKNRINHAWHQKKQKEKYRKDDKKAINTHIRKDVKEMLDELTVLYGMSIGNLLEMLITEKYINQKQ